MPRKKQPPSALDSVPASRRRARAGSESEETSQSESSSEFAPTSDDEGGSSDSASDDEDKTTPLPPPPPPASSSKRASTTGRKRKVAAVTSEEDSEDSDFGGATRRKNNSTRVKKSTGRARAANNNNSSSSAQAVIDDDSGDELVSSARKKRSKSSPLPSGGPVDPDELPDEWRCSANDALTFRLVRSAPEKETAQATSQVESVTFHPTFTHQLWDDEEIVGYKKVKASVAFTAGALYTYLKVEYEEKYPNTDVPDIQSLIASKLRGGFTLDYDDFQRHIHDPFVPPGDLLSEYTVPSVDLSFKEQITYQVYRGRFDNPLMRAYHQRLQFFLLFFIDRSSYINDADLVWEIILLFQKRVCLTKNVTTYNIVGYTTLYKFLAYPSDWRMRLSQILILPPYQRAGHGQKLLQLVYAEAERRQMIEVNIEDPSPVFQMLRDLTDITLCRKGRFFEKQAGSDVDPLDQWDPVYASVVKASLRITMSQVRRCFEIFRLNAVTDRHKNSKSMSSYRLSVKSRLFRESQEVLSLYSQKAALRKEKLAEMYNELEQHYLAVIKKARLH